MSEAAAAGTPGVMDGLRGKLEQAQAGGGNLAVLLIECGVIGRIDAAWGYHVGDAVRERVIASLRADLLRPGDLAGWMARDDLACILSPVEGPAVAVLAARKLLRALALPFWIGDEEIHANPSIGITLFAADADQAETLLQRAKRAAVLARGLPGHIAEHAADGDEQLARALIDENRLRSAVAEDALDLVFQPQYDLRRGQVMGAEGLLYLHDAGRGIVPAGPAFAAAEAANKVTELVSSMLNRALRNVSEFRYSAGLDLRIGVKLPARALRFPEIVDVVQRALGTWSRRPGTLILQIGETAVLGTDAVARETLGRLKELGVKLSIDDADMAMSSLFWLATMPFQEIRLDVAQMHDLAGAPKSVQILKAIIDLAHQLKLDVVAVGVTDEVAAAQLTELGCDTMQADFKGPALGPKEFVERFGFNED